MGREGIQYILIIMGRGGNKISKFPKNLNFQKSSKFQIFYRISKKKKIKIENISKKFQFQYFKNFKKFENVHKISKLTYFIRLKKIKKKIQNFHRILRKFSKFQNLYIMNLIFFLKLVSLRFPI